MARSRQNPNFDQLLDSLRAQGFAVIRNADSVGVATVIKDGAAAVLAPAKDAEAVLTAGPGAWMGGHLARLVDRGYQKFLSSGQGELPASAEQLSAIHRFDQELRLWIGCTGLYNESLGTTCDLCQYDRLNGRAAAALVADDSGH